MAGSLDEEDLATHGRNAWAQFSIACKTFENNDATVSEQPHATALRSEMQRFQLWAINLGLFRQDHSSLDYRLRDNDVVRSFTRDLLTNLIEALKEITNIASSGDAGSPSEVAEMLNSDAERTGDNDSSSIGIHGGSSDAPIIMGTLNDEDESMTVLHFEDVTEAINQMYSLASQIRSPTARKIRTDVELFKEVDSDIKSEYIKLREKAELQGIEQMLLQSRKSLLGLQVEETYPVLTNKDQCLIQRLQQGNNARRRQFEFWKRSKKRSVRAAFKAIETIQCSNDDNERLKNVFQQDIPVQTPALTRSLVSSVPALPEGFVLGGKKSTFSGTSRGLTVHGPSGEKVNWPKPPVAGPLSEDFECPFCFYFCPPRYSEGAAWRSHLKHDLRPYVCTYDDCTEPNTLYDSWEEWTRHEQWAHQQRIWRCLEHPQYEYVELAAYQDHVRTYHAASMVQLLSTELLTSQESVSQVCDRPCPFCQREFERPNDLQQHIAGHLEIIALLSLPNLDDIDDISEAGEANSNSANHHLAESKAGDFDLTEPLAFLENERPGNSPVMTDAERGLFETKLKNESISFEFNEVSVEARQAYSDELVGRWLYRLQRELGEEPAIHSFLVSEGQMNSHKTALLAIAETAQDIAAALHKFLRPLDNQSAEIIALIAECFSTSSALRKLDKKIGNFPHHQRYSLISDDLTTVKDSLNFTFTDVQRIFGGLGRVAVIPRAEYGYVWEDLCDFFRAESGNPLRRRLEIYCIVLEELSNILTKGLPRDSDSYADLLNKIERLLDTQHNAFAQTFGVRDRKGLDEWSQWVQFQSLTFVVETRPPSFGKEGLVDDRIPPGSKPASFEEMRSADEQGTDSSDHWLPSIFNQSIPSTSFKSTARASVSLGESTPGTMASLEEAYVSLIELPFENGGLIVRLYYRPADGRSRFFCRTIHSASSRKDCSIRLASLDVSRDGRFLDFYRLDQPKKASERWASLKFLDYESLVLFFCSFLALRSEDSASPAIDALGFRIHGEVDLFAGRIVDDHYEHGLRLLHEKDTGVMRLQASAQTGALKWKPIWTAFITDQIHTPTWASRASSRVVHLADLQRFIFTTDYEPQKTSTGKHELTFILSDDARDFMKTIKELDKKHGAKVAEKPDTS